MKRVLVYGMTDNLGGMETFMQSYIRGMQDNNIVFDFIAPYEKIAIEQEVIALGGKVYHLPSRKKSFLNIIADSKSICRNMLQSMTPYG